MLELVQELAKLGIWVRLHYVYPYPSVDDVIPLDGRRQGAAVSGRAVPARQPAHPQGDETPGTSENTLRRIERWREVCPRS
jgi:ribosomal protein S12 methylthiotransferase